MDTMVINKMYFPGLPGLSELVLRGFRGAEDFPKMLACINGCKAADGVERSDKLDDIINNYAHLHHCNPETDMCLAEVDGQVVGYSRVWWEIDEYAQHWTGFHFGFLLPEWRKKGIGSAILRFNEERLAQIYAECKAAGEIPEGLPGVCDCFIEDTARDTIALLERYGYVPVRYGFNMVRPDLENIPDCPLPEGLEVRQYQPDHLRKIWEASNEAFKDHWGYIAEPWEEYERLQHDSSFDPTLWRVAWEGGRVVGMVLSFINRDENAEYGRLRGYTENICVRREWRKCGVARALIALSLQALKERGMTEAALGVDAENLSGALRLYESMGYKVVRKGITYRKAIVP